MIKLKEIIKEEDYNKQYVKEAYRTPDELGAAMRRSIDELSVVLKKAQKGRLGPEGWAKKYFRSAPKAIEMIEHLIGILKKMK